MSEPIAGARHDPAAWPPAVSPPALGEPGLLRGIRRWDVLALMINCTIGAGIFGLPSRVYALIGPWSLLAFAACGALVALIVLCFAEVASRFDRTGGPSLYARAAFGPLIGFEVGWLLWLVRLTSYAALCNLLISYLGVLWPGAEGPAWRPALIVAVTVALALVNLIGVRSAALTGNAFTIGKLLPLLLLVGAGLAAVEPARLVPGPTPEAASFGKAALLLVFAFTGFEMVIIPGGEVRDARRNLPWGLLGGLAVVIVLYMAIQTVCVGTVPDLAGSERPLTDAAARVLGPAGATLVTAGALVSITGTLGAVLLAAPRLPFALAEWGTLPRVLAATHPRFHTPSAAILLSAALMLALALSSTFLGALTISTIIRLVTYVATCAALLVLRRRPEVPEATFRAPAGGALALLAIGACVWLLTTISVREAAMAALAAALGLMVYALGRRAAPKAS